jgi:hypothetical protein
MNKRAPFVVAGHFCSSVFDRWSRLWRGIAFAALVALAPASAEARTEHLQPGCWHSNTDWSEVDYERLQSTGSCENCRLNCLD